MITDTQKVAADRVAADKAASEKDGALAGAQAVAAAVNKVANAAVAEVQKTHAGGVAPDLVASGIAGGKLRIEGTGFSSSGTVRVNGVVVPTNGWSSTRIEGNLPANVRSGVVEVEVDKDTIRRGYLHL